MVRLREIPRTATFAWSPGSDTPLVVTGTRAGAVDADFSDETKLELWDLSLDTESQGLELQPIASISAESRFHDIAWAPANAEHPRGIIAGALENGSLDLWDAEKLINGDSDAFISRTTKHTGAIKSLQFNPLKPQILATAGTKGELYIYDINDISNPFRLGTAAARSDDLNCIAWNRKVPHILATGGSGGFVTVWDLKTKKASLTLNNHRKAVGAIAWDPQNATKLLTATPDDSTPVILLWDLRNSNAPERTLQGHEQGVLSLSWCSQDSDLLLSCGKDNRTIVWNPQTGERLGEFPEVTNWTFQTQFHPHNPNLSATASFDGKIIVQTLQNTNASTSSAAALGPGDGEDFFNQAQSQPQGESFTLAKAPKWFERPVGASFGFGGKLVTYGLQESVGGRRSSKVQITHFQVDSSVGTAAESFETALKSGDIKGICESNISSAKTDEEKADWNVIEALITENPRQSVINYLGFADSEEITNGIDGLSLSEEKAEAASETDAATSKKQRLSMFFADGNDDFLSNITAGKGAKTDSPFKLYGESDSASDKQITKALLLGQFEKATDICIKEERLADAFMIANCGGKELLDKVQSAYLAQKSKGPNYVRLLGSVIVKNLWDVVYNADLADWKEIMATLCTYATPSEFSDLCEALGDRVLESGSRKDASFCYLVGSKLEKVTNIWIDELQELEQSDLQNTEGSSFSVHANIVQKLIEKVTVFRDVTKFEDKEQDLTSDWKLASLYDKYIEYADIVASHGHLSTAEKYLDLVPATYSAADLSRSRVKLATRKGAPAARQAQTTSRTTARAQPSYGYGAPAPVQPPVPAATSAFIPTAPSPAANMYAPPAPITNAPTSSSAYAPPANAYIPQPNFQPIQQTPSYGGNGPMGYTQGGTPNNFAPPRTTTPSAPPPPRTNIPNWNDTPMVTKPPPARRSTPHVITGPSTAGGQSGISSPPTGSHYGPPKAGATPPPPPPKASGPPRVSSPFTSGASQSYQPSPSAAASTYAPPPSTFGQPPPTTGMSAPPQIPRGASPYNPPPSTAPPSSRYAPTPVSQTAPAPTGPPPGGIRRPPSAQYGQPSSQPPPNPYAPSPVMNTQPGGFNQQAPPQGPPQNGPPMGGPPMGGPPRSQTASTATPPPRAAAPPTKPKHPAGDRSHIPNNARELVEIFSADMQRVAAKAPASFAKEVRDTQKRLNILFDHLNNEELLKPDTIEKVTELARALRSRDYDAAHRLQVEIQKEKTAECGTWMPGVKRLISMSKVTA